MYQYIRPERYAYQWIRKIIAIRASIKTNTKNCTNENGQLKKKYDECYTIANESSKKSRSDGTLLTRPDRHETKNEKLSITIKRKKPHKKMTKGQVILCEKWLTHSGGEKHRHCQRVDTWRYTVLYDKPKGSVLCNSINLCNAYKCVR